MDNNETKQALARIDGLWSHQKMDAGTLATIGSMIADRDFAAVMSAIQRLAATEEWFHVSKLLKALAAAPSLDWQTAYRRALNIRTIYGDRASRNHHASDAIAATVRRLGDWRSLGHRENENPTWGEKRFQAAWEEVHAELAAGRPMAELLPAPRIMPVQGATTGVLKGQGS